MSTFGELTDSILLHLSGLGSAQDQATYLTGSVTSGALSIPVADATALSRGLVEIEDELLWVDAVNASGLLLTVPPYGRGYRSTVAAAHASGVRVVSAPAISRSMVKGAINETIQSLYPDLYGVASTSFTYVSGTYTYGLPTGTETVLQVQWQDSTTQSEWLPVRRYDVDGNADSDVFPGGVSITVRDGVIPGRTVRVVYTEQPRPMIDAGDQFSTTGLLPSVEDVVRLGASHRLIPFLDIPHLSGQSAEADFSANSRNQQSSPVATAKWMLQNYQIRLQQESAKLNSLYPVRVRYTF